MLRDFIKLNKYYLLTILLMLLTFILVKHFYSYDILVFDNYIHEKLINCFNSKIISNVLYVFTSIGSVYFYVIVLFILLFINKKYFKLISLSLSVTYLFCFIYKNIIRRDRPGNSLIDMPRDYSFPSGHTTCSVLFYGLLIYIVNRNISNKYIKILFDILLFIIILLIAFSRLYFGVHYLSDVIVGILLGIISLKMFINYFNYSKII